MYSLIAERNKKGLRQTVLFYGTVKKAWVDLYHSLKKQKDSLEGSLVRVFFAAEFSSQRYKYQDTSEYIKYKHWSVFYWLCLV